MILPERVFGSEFEKRIISGLARAPICLRTCSFNCCLSESSPSLPVNVTKQQIPSPFRFRVTARKTHTGAPISQ